MLDISITSVSRSLILFSTLFYFQILLLYWKRCTSFQYHCSKRETRALFILVLIFAILSWTNGDWLHYQQIVTNPVQISNNSSGMEELYENVASSVNYNYLLFRLVVWGSALFLFVLSLRTLNVDVASALFLLIAIFINYFDYSRSALGITTYFTGLSFLLQKKRNILRIIGIGLILLAPSLHRSTTVLTVLTFIVLIPINKRTIPIIILAIVFAFSALKEYFSLFMDNMIHSDNDFSAKASFYMNQSRTEIVSGSIIGIIVGYWKYLVFYVFMICESYYLFRKGNYYSIHFPIRAIYNVCFSIFIFAIVMYFFNIGHMAFYYRFLMMTYVPLIIIAVYLFKNRMMPHRVYMSIIWFGSGYLMFDFLYRCAIGQ